MLSIKDKEKAFFTENKQELSVIAELPLKLSSENSAAPNLSVFSNMPLCRKNEQSKIAAALKNSDLRRLSTYRPLCICSDSEYILKKYAETIVRACPKSHTEMINISDLTAHDIDATPNNIFVRNINEDKDNYFLMFFVGNIYEGLLDAALGFLQSDRRAKFHLNCPNLTLDLSNVLPVCFCDRKNAKLIRHLCEIVEISEISKEEFPKIIEYMVLSKQNLYGVKGVKISDDAYEMFSGYDIDVIERTTDAALRACRNRAVKVTLTADMFSEYLPENDTKKIGFGMGGN